jgi:hypothetical protein
MEKTPEPLPFHTLRSSVSVDGALVIRAVPGASVTVDGLTVNNTGWEWKVPGPLVSWKPRSLIHPTTTTHTTPAAACAITDNGVMHRSVACALGPGGGRGRARVPQDPGLQGR